MIDHGGRVFNARSDVLTLKGWVVLENFLLGDSSGQQVEHVFYPDAHSADAGASAALI